MQEQVNKPVEAAPQVAVTFKKPEEKKAEAATAPDLTGLSDKAKAVLAAARPLKQKVTKRYYFYCFGCGNLGHDAHPDWLPEDDERVRVALKGLDSDVDQATKGDRRTPHTPVVREVEVGEDGSERVTFQGRRPL